MIATEYQRVGEQLNDLLVQIGTMPGSEDAILLGSLLLDGGEFLENVRDAPVLFFYPELWISDVWNFSLGFGEVLRGIVLAQTVVAVVGTAEPYCRGGFVFIIVVNVVFSGCCTEFGVDW